MSSRPFRRSRRRDACAAAVVLAVGMLGAAAPVPAATVAYSGTGATTVYAGTTNGAKQPLVVETSRGRVRSISQMWTAGCGRGTYFFGGRLTSRRGLPISRAGRFSGRWSAVRDLGGGSVGHVTVAISGTIRGATLRGSLSGSARVVGPDGATVDTCTRGTTGMAYTLTHAPGREFGGVTNQGLPVAVELTGGRTSVRHLHIGWRASCASGDVFQWGEFLTDFPLQHGRFGETFATDYKDEAGNIEHDQYGVRGTVGRSRATGQLTLTMTFTDAAGNQQDVCAIPTVTFTAAS